MAMDSKPGRGLGCEEDGFMVGGGLRFVLVLGFGRIRLGRFGREREEGRADGLSREGWVVEVTEEERSWL
jgi:hypothetical protein